MPHTLHNLGARAQRRVWLCLVVLLVACSEPPAETDTTDAPAPDSAAAAKDSAPAAPAEPAPLPPALAALNEPWTGDLDGMLERRVIRVALPHTEPLFFYSNGTPRGILYEFVQQFEKDLNATYADGHLKIYVVPVPMPRRDMIADLLDGHIDLVTADLTVTTGRKALVDFSLPLLRDVHEVVVAGPAAPPLASLRDLAGQTVYVRKSSSYHEHLSGLSASFVAHGLEAIDVQPAEEFLEARDLLEMINASMLPMTVVDDYRANLWVDVFPNIAVREDLAVNEGGSIAWAWRQDSPKLAGLVNKFIRKHRPGTLFGNVVLNKYLEDRSWLQAATGARDLDKLRGLADVFKTHARDNDLDWLMLAAQAYQESGLRQDRVSPAGAVGIMQIKLSTARDKNVGVEDISTIDANVEAGARYMRFLKDRYFTSDAIDPLDQWLFALAAYNAGPAKVVRMRSQARAEGRDPNVWFQNVEVVAARQIGRETVQYVSNVFKYFVGYRLVWEQNRKREASQLRASGPL
ncbi:MAG: transporter substrate-binding domain-containing protein [Pseudomonadota bacterium]